jgi:hypothetical protein
MITKEEKIRHRITTTIRDLEEVREQLEQIHAKQRNQLEYYTYDLLDKVISKLKVTLDLDFKTVGEPK